MTTYASVHFDGTISCSNLVAGLLETPGLPSPVVNFRVTAGLQSHPAWALDRLAVVVYCYGQAARQGSPLGTGEFIQVNVQGTLVSNEHTSITVAHSIHWHTSRRVRELAEHMITEIASNGKFSDWPDTKLRIPVTPEEIPRKKGSRSQGN